MTMSIKSIALAGAALLALTAGVGVAQAADDQDDEVRQLNIQQLEQARSDTPTPSQPSTAPDGQGGPEFQGPPSPDEGMDDDNTADEPAADDKEPAEEEVPQGPEEDDPAEPK